MIRNHAARLLVLVIGVIMTLSVSPTDAQTQTDADQAKLRADYADALKREAESKKAAAVAEADAANAAQAARAALAKSETDADKAKLDYYKAMAPSAPDPSKYKIAAPTAPIVAGTAARMAYMEATHVSGEVAKAILEALKTDLATADVLILPEDPKTRTLISLSRALREALDQARARLVNERLDLDRKMTQQPTALIAGAAIPVLASIAETVLSYANILRTQYAFGTSSQTSLAEIVLQAKVQETLVATSKIKVIEPDAIVAMMASGAKQPPELDRLRALQTELGASRQKVIDAGGVAAQLRANAPKPKDDKDKAATDQRAAALKLADDIDAKAKTVAAAAEEVDKMLATLYIADAQGNTPLDSALRGGMLNDMLASGKAYMLSLKAVSSDVDTIAADGLFRGLRVAVASNTVARWRLTGLDGVVKSVGAVQKNSQLERIKLPD